MHNSVLKENFKHPPEGYGLVPFWFWNDDLDENHLLFQMKEMKDKGIEEFIIHARKGITVKYLSDIWFDKVRYTLDKAKDLGMKVWVYDEENWPSGYAGGRVLADNPEFCAKYLMMEKLKSAEDRICIPVKTNHQIVYILAQTMEGSLINLTDKIEENKLKNENYCSVYCFYVGNTLWNPAYSDEYYVDLINKEAVASFMKHTHFEYKKRLGKYFGNVIKGFFVDEPGFYNNFLLYEDREDRYTIPWTEEFASYFFNKNGHDITQILPYIWEGEEKETVKARVEFYHTLAYMYKENFFEPIKKFCEDHGMESIGHVHVEEYLSYHIRTQGDMMEVLDSLSFSGIDRIDTNYEKVAEKYGSSAAHIFGHKRTMSETYANIGWSITMEQMKEIANWQYVRGINLLIPHAFYSSIEDDRKWECPPSEFFQAPFWPNFKQFSEYVKRLSYLLSQGSHVCKVAVYYPVKSCQAALTPFSTTDVDQYDSFFINMSNTLLDAQYDFDYITDRVIANANIADGQLLVRDEQYKVIILPSVYFMPFETVDKLRRFAESGGVVINVGNTHVRSIEPECKERFKDIWNEVLQMKNVFQISKYSIHKSYTYEFDGDKVVQIFKKNGIGDLKLLNKDSDIKYLHRRYENNDIYFIINESACKKTFDFQVEVVGRIEKWEALDGSVIDYYAVSRTEYSMVVRTDIQPYGANIFVIKPGTPRVCKSDAGIVYAGDNTWQVKANGTYFMEIDGQEKLVNISGIPQTIQIGGLWDIEVMEGKLQKPLGSWTDWGYEYYTGQVKYVKSVIISVKEDITYTLDLGEVRDSAEVRVNGKQVGCGLWAAYEFDITNFLVEGQNCIEVIVTNTLANELEKKPLNSGLIGPVEIRGSKLLHF